jgi:hypothetical protein
MNIGIEGCAIGFTIWSRISSIHSHIEFHSMNFPQVFFFKKRETSLLKLKKEKNTNYFQANKETNSKIN